MGYKERERDREKGEQREKGIEGELTEREGNIGRKRIN